MAFTVIYDACVLYPAPLRDLLVRLGTTGLFRARWTNEILDEVFETSSRIVNNRTLLELTELDANDHSSCESCVELVRERAGAAIDNTRVANEFTTVAAEVIGNIEEWSEARIRGIAAIQRYSNRIAISIGDAGLGILGSLRKNVDLGDQSDNEVLGRVFTDGLSSRGTPGSGAGLRKCGAISARRGWYRHDRRLRPCLQRNGAMSWLCRSWTR